MSSDMHDLLSRMADELDNYRQLLTDDRREVHALAAEARAALAAAPESAVKQSLTTAPPAPLEGEVGELVAWLLTYASEEFGPNSDHPDAARIARAADLLSQQAAPAPAVVPVAIPGEQWHEDDGACLWWRLEIDEAPWVGDPRDSDWPGYHTHFTRIVCPVLPAPQGGEGEG